MTEIAADKDYSRLDVFVAEALDIPRNRAQKYIRAEFLGSGLKPSMPVHAGDKFNADIPESKNITALVPENIAFDVVYQDKYLLVINKPPRLVVHPAPGNWTGTLVNGLVYRYPEMLKMSGFMRPGIVHRLDSGTSGLMTVARTEKSYILMQKMFLERKVRKKYLALLHGSPAKHEGILSGPIAHDPNNYAHMIIADGGKNALTGYKVLWSKNNISLVMCELFTGRTHQIRVHMSALGCPLIGDTMYGAQNFGDIFDGRIYLHSWKLEFTHPVTGQAMSFTQYIPEDFKSIIYQQKGLI